jgi:hypothetical protein
LYCEQKQWFSEDDTILKPKASTLQAKIACLGQQVIDNAVDLSNGYFAMDSNEEIAAKVFTRLTNKINAQMELDSNASITQTDAGKIKKLNAALVTQLGDFAEFEAMINDLKDIGYTINWENVQIQYSHYVSYKNGLQFDSKSFDPNFLKQDLFLANGKKEEEQTALA